MIKNILFRKPYLFVIAVLFCFLVAEKTFAKPDKQSAQIRAIGKIESIYRNRVSMQILKIIGTYTPELTLATGSWVSYDLPKTNNAKKRRRHKRRPSIKYGSIVDVTLIGNPITEYEPSKDQLVSTVSNSETDAADKTVLMWTAQSIQKLKHPDDYLPNSKKAKRNRRHRRRHKKKKKKPVKTWTQEETVRGKILIRKKRLYIREARVRGKRAKGLDVIDDEWYEKLKPYKGQDVVVYGKTHRVNISSGTIEIKSIMKIYPK